MIRSKDQFDTEKREIEENKSQGQIWTENRIKGQKQERRGSVDFEDSGILA